MATAAHEDRRRDFAVAACGAATSVLTAVLLWWIDRSTGFALYTFTVWLVVPAGAVLAGLAAASGYYAGARLIHVRPTAALRLWAVGISIGTFFLVHWLGYAVADDEGVRAADVVSFGGYLDAVLRSSSFEFRLETTALAETGELGALGYVAAGLQIVGFALGGLVMPQLLAGIPFCRPCGRYMASRARMSRWSVNALDAAGAVRRFRGEFESGDPQEAVDALAEFGQRKEMKTSRVRIDVALMRCARCRDSVLLVSRQQREDEEWSEVEGSVVRLVHRGGLTLRR
jgi:hypothetical protein